MMNWNIEPTPPYDGAFAGRGAWKAPNFSGLQSWIYRLKPETVSELDHALEAIKEKGKTLQTLESADFPLASFRSDAAKLSEDLMRGRGFIIVKGLPRDRYSGEEASMLYWGIGSFFGRTLPQNVKGDRVYSVRDEGYNIDRDYGTVGVRFSKTTEGLHFHTDSAPALMGDTPDIVGLLALSVAKSGGESLLVSAQTVHNQMRAERPDYLARLYQPYHFDRRAELREGESPTLYAPVFRYTEALEIRYFRFYIPKGHELIGQPLTEADVAPLDYLESIMNRPELQVSFEMQAGDMQFVNNRFILHSRTKFEDHAEPERRRHLVRLWLKQ
jgi:hypothetical protein